AAGLGAVGFTTTCGTGPEPGDAGGEAGEGAPGAAGAGAAEDGGCSEPAFGLSVAGAWAGADSWDRARTDSSMVAGRSRESSRHTAAKLCGTQRMTHSGIGAMASAKGRVDEKDSSRRSG
ncbi:MAG: hypothetical protein WAN75_29250, partial [Xanthobacteraceae bacterium]